jgi:hypothetical protein
MKEEIKIPVSSETARPDVVQPDDFLLSRSAKITLNVESSAPSCNVISRGEYLIISAFSCIVPKA